MPIEAIGDYRVIAELERCRRLDSPAVASFVELIEHHGSMAVVLEGVAGATFDQLLALLADAGGEAVGPHSTSPATCSTPWGTAHVTMDEAGKTVPLVHGQLTSSVLRLRWLDRVAELGLACSKEVFGEDFDLHLGVVVVARMAAGTVWRTAGGIRSCRWPGG
ncbi:MAG TPA: hypothetical protein ENK57_12990 [Polyangiaceae bacterium]|nr:hypothetical protein [Polyangiaceae bacterium]